MPEPNPQHLGFNRALKNWVVDLKPYRPWVDAVV